MSRSLMIVVCLLLIAQLGASPYALAARLWHVNSQTCAPHLASQCHQQLGEKPACQHCHPAPQKKPCDCRLSVGGVEQPELCCTVTLKPVDFSLAPKASAMAWNHRCAMVDIQLIEAAFGLPPPPLLGRANLLRGPPNAV